MCEKGSDFFTMSTVGLKILILLSIFFEGNVNSLCWQIFTYATVRVQSFP